MPKTKVFAITCPLCGYTVFSRARHDFRSCQCRAVSIDGGFDYMKCSFDSERVKPPVPFGMFVPATKAQMYEDWNCDIGYFGLIPPTEKDKKHGSATAARTDRPRARRAPAVNSKRKAPSRKSTRR